MKDKIHIHYDSEADYLEIRFGKVTPAIYEDVGDDIFQRQDEKTGQIKGYSIFNFIKRGKDKIVSLNLKLPKF